MYLPQLDELKKILFKVFRSGYVKDRHTDLTLAVSVMVKRQVISVVGRFNTISYPCRKGGHTSPRALVLLLLYISQRVDEY